MAGNRLTSAVFEYLDTVADHLNGYASDQRPEHLHRLRVAIKKIRACLSFIQNVHDVRFKLELLRNVFRKAGEIRELQMHAALLLSLPYPPKKILARLREDKAGLEKKFIEDLPAHLQQLNEFRESLPGVFTLPNEQVAVYYLRNQKNKAVKRFNSHEREKLHDFRKQVKKLMYVQAVLSKRIQQKTELDKELLDELQNALGNWHDTDAAIAFLSHESFKQKRTYLPMLREKEQQQFDELFERWPNLKL